MNVTSECTTHRAFNRDAIVHPQALHEFFERQVIMRPQHPALQCAGETLTYQMLNKRANDCAKYLRMRGVGPGQLVALYLPKTPELFIALLGVLKAGAGYVPIDPKFPSERIASIIDDAETRFLLTSRALAARLAGRPAEIALIIESRVQPRGSRPVQLPARAEAGLKSQDPKSKDLKSQDPKSQDPKSRDLKSQMKSQVPKSRDPKSQIQKSRDPKSQDLKSQGVRSQDLKSDDVCYAIFTSGSTGLPKGVAVEHRHAVAFVSCLKPTYGVKPEDRVYQGFSLAFDAAVEEVWMAWSVGATLVVASEDQARSPADAAQFISEQNISVVSTVPTFLAMITDELPKVRLLIVGGEACPPELVERWAHGRRMLNTYGPTEATVVATMSELKPGKPVTIGKALPGYYVRVLSEDMQPVKPGEAGELYVGGAGVARGYIKRPELTAERFMPDPFAAGDGRRGRLYRTYDHVRLLPSGDLEYLGRLDAQIKIRGFRVELSEIEAVLLNYPPVKAAAAKVAGEGEQRELAAFVVPANGSSVDRGEIAVLLRSRLPEYMVPKYLDLIDALPLTTSGKVDRKALPQPVELLKSSGVIVTPATPLERAITSVWEEILHVSPVSVEADFFRDLGGHSLVAAKAISTMRNRLGAPNLAVRELYRRPTVRKLAGHLGAMGVLEKPGEENTQAADAMVADETEGGRTAARAPLPLWRRRATGLLQAVGLYLYYSAITAPFVYAFLMLNGLISGEIDQETALNNVFLMGFLAWPAFFFLSVAMKWLVIGRYKPGCYPVWGWYYFRWWLVTRFQTLAWSHMFVGTPLMSLYYRLMGAKVGRCANIGTDLCSAFDVVSIGDDTSIGVETQLLGCRVEDGMLVIGPVEIGSRCFVGMHCALGLGVKMKDDARLDDMSLLPDGKTISAGQAWRGSPAAPVDAVETPELQGQARRHPILFGLIHLVLIYVMGYFLILTMAPTVILSVLAFQYGGLSAAAAAVFISAPIDVLWYILCVVMFKWLFIGRVRPGTFRVESLTYLRYWFLNYLLNNTRQILLSLYATCYLPAFLRLLGARIGKHAEVSTVLQMTPDLVEIGNGSFCADASLIGGDRIHRGVISIKLARIGDRTFIGNSAFAPGGVDIGNDCLVGVMSTPPQGLAGPVHGVRWLGSPGFELPGTQHDIVFDERTTFRPNPRLIALRAVVDAMRVFLPGLAAAGALVMFVLSLVFAYEVLPLWAMAASAPAAAFAISWLSIEFAAWVKELLIGTFEPTVKPLYSPYIWLNEVVNAVYEAVAAPAMDPLMGTPFIAPALRRMGCKIGRWVFLDTTLFSEFDLVRIDDYAALNVGATIQTHLFEDRIFKADTLHIGPSCSIGNMAVILYGAHMQEGSWLGPLSVLMKGETLPARSRWHGVPTEPAFRPPFSGQHLAATPPARLEAEPTPQDPDGTASDRKSNLQSPGFKQC